MAASQLIRVKEPRFDKRRKKVLQAIKGESAIFPAAPIIPLSLDRDHEFRQNSDFLYLTGYEEAEAVLVLRGNRKGPRSVLFLRDRNQDQERWTGERLGIKRAKKRFLVDEIRNIKSLTEDLPKLIAGTAKLHYAPCVHQELDKYIFSLFQTSLSPRLHFPLTLSDSRLITSELRSVKDREEIQNIKHAVDITKRSFVNLFKEIKNLNSEAHAAKYLEAQFARFGSKEIAFSTIVASGRNATVLHHSPKLQPLWKKDLVLIDAGASYQGYAADISRTVPCSGKFSKSQAEVYEVVLSALHTCIERSKPGATLNSIHKTATREITKGLVKLKILSGDINKLLQAQAYKKFFMHNTGHWLGIDVHDISPLSQKQNGDLLSSRYRQLVPGNVFTIEPGLYFDPKDKTIPKEYKGIGIRIEDNIVITVKGCQVISKDITKERAEIEKIMK